MRFWNCFRFELAPKRAAAAIATVCLCVTSAAAEGRPRHRPIGPVVVRDPVPYWRQYFGPPTSYGSPYYRMMAPRYFAPPPPYVGYGYNSYGYNGYGYGSAAGYVYPGPYVGFGVTAPAPLYRTQAAPRVDLSNPALQETLLENQLRWGTELPPNAFPSQTRVRVRPSTPEKQAKSIHAQAEGDVYMKRLRFLNAYEKFKYAVGVANDRPEPYFRLAYALAAIGSYDSAVKYLKQGITLDPQWPVHGEKLIGVFGDDNRLAILSLIERVTGWVRDDIRDPDRLFLMGVLLHFNDDNRAGQFFEAAYRLAGGGDHLLVFLQPQLDARENAAAAECKHPDDPATERRSGARRATADDRSDSRSGNRTSGHADSAIGPDSRRGFAEEPRSDRSTSKHRRSDPKAHSVVSSAGSYSGGTRDETDRSAGKRLAAAAIAGAGRPDAESAIQFANAGTCGRTFAFPDTQLQHDSSDSLDRPR